MNRIVFVLLLSACDLTTHGQRGAPQPEPALGPCCVDELCVQPRVGQRACDDGLFVCTGEAERISALGPLWECRETSPVTKNAGSYAAEQ